MRTGIAAADPDLLPVGSVIQVYKLGERYNGIYTIMDTGPGRSRGATSTSTCGAATRRWSSGRRDIAINVLRLGWNPKASTPTLVERLFRQREAAQRAEPPSPLPFLGPIEIAGHRSTSIDTGAPQSQAANRCFVCLKECPLLRRSSGIDRP